MTSASEFLWYIPNQVTPGHRGDTIAVNHNSLDALTDQARALEDYGWTGALIGTGWGRPDTFTVATALAARTSRFEPLIAARPGYWHPAHFASATATLDHLTQGRIRINIVSGQDNLQAYGDKEEDQTVRYDRTKEFMRLTRKLWTEEKVDWKGRYYEVTNATLKPGIRERTFSEQGERPHPPLYFGGASAAAQHVAATEADVQLFWGEPLDDIAQRIDTLKRLAHQLDRDLPPLEFGLRITTFVRDSTDEAWRDAEAKVAQMAASSAGNWDDHRRFTATGQKRLLNLQSRGEVLDDALYTTPGKYGGGGAGTTWLVGSPQDVAKSLRKYRDLGITRFILSDTPYLAEIKRQGEQLLPLLRRWDDAP